MAVGVVNHAQPRETTKGRTNGRRRSAPPAAGGFCVGHVAESEGFEPPIPLRVLLISNQVPSAARPALRKRGRGSNMKFGGEGGIRTHDTLPYTRFPSVRLRPLGHLSGSYFRRARKNSLSSSPHSVARTPEATWTWWFKRASRGTS